VTETVLLVGGDGPGVRGLGEAFARFGYAVASAPTVDAGLVALARRPPAVVILDLARADARGVELCERLRWTAGSVLVLASSAAALDRLVSAAASGHGRPGHREPGGERPHLPRTVAEVARAHIARTLEFHGGNRTRAARELGISRATLINKIRAYGL
jgi:DNA-binding NtrC family response regulator